MEKIRKEVHLPLQLAQDLKIVAAHADKSPKKYIEDLIISEVKTRIEKVNKKA